MGKYGLSFIEWEIMEYFWEQNQPVPFKEILDYFNQKKNMNWKKQTLNTYLSNLRRSKLICVDDKSSAYYKYYSCCSREQLIGDWTHSLIQESFGGSISNFVATFAGGKKLSPEEVERIKKLI